jgi:hypothetical protein
VSPRTPPTTSCRHGGRRQRSPHLGRRGVAGRRVLAVAANASDHTLPTRCRWSPPRNPHRGQTSSRVPGTSGSAPRVTARTSSEEEARLQQDQAVHTRSGYAARKGSALAVGSDDQEQPPFAKMEGPMTGLMELTNGIQGLPNPAELPREPSTRWSHEDVSPTPYLSSWDFHAVFHFCF